MGVPRVKNHIFGPKRLPSARLGYSLPVTFLIQPDGITRKGDPVDVPLGGKNDLILVISEI